MPTGRRGDFWSNVERMENGCWLWRGARNRYGRFYTRGRTRLAHRVAYENLRGPIPPGLNCCHKCDEPLCVNPDHLFLGTQADNLRDMVAKGRARHLRGSRHRCAKLTEAKVARIRRLLARGVSQPELARRYGVSPATISDIRCDQTWKHVPWPDGAPPPAGQQRKKQGGPNGEEDRSR